jgi:predicted nucleic acid-binding protein
VNDLFVDTSAFFALANLADRHHAEAVAAFRSSVGDADFKTSDHIILETWCLIRSRLGRRAAMAFWGGFDSGVVSVLGVGAQDLQPGREIAQAPHRPLWLAAPARARGGPLLTPRAHGER